MHCHNIDVGRNAWGTIMFFIATDFFAVFFSQRFFICISFLQIVEVVGNVKSVFKMKRLKAFTSDAVKNLLGKGLCGISFNIITFFSNFQCARYQIMLSVWMPDQWTVKANLLGVAPSISISVKAKSFYFVKSTTESFGFTVERKNVL